MSGFDRTKYEEICKYFSKTDRRYINVKVYTYDGGDKKISINPTEKNTNPNADDNKKWINKKGISGLTKDEAKDLVIALERAMKEM